MSSRGSPPRVGRCSKRSRPSLNRSRRCLKTQPRRAHRPAAPPWRACALTSLHSLASQAIRDLKASAKESAREIDDFRGAGARIIASHEAACEKQMKSADAKTEGLAKMQIRLAPVVKELAKLTRAIEADGP